MKSFSVSAMIRRRLIFCSLLCFSLLLGLTALADSDDLAALSGPSVSLISSPDPLFVGQQPATYAITDGSDTDLITLMIDFNLPGIQDPFVTARRAGGAVADAAWIDAERIYPDSPHFWKEVKRNGTDLIVPLEDSPPGISDNPEPSTIIMFATGLLVLFIALRKRLTCSTQ
jgi:hypothetical protein